MKSFYLLVVCLLFAGNAAAQTCATCCNCMNIGWSLVGDAINDGAFWIANETRTYKVTCTYYGRIMDTYNNAVTATGSGGWQKHLLSSDTEVVCNPKWAIQAEYGVKVQSAWMEDDAWDGVIENNNTTGATCYYSDPATPDHKNRTYCGSAPCKTGCTSGGSPIVIDIGGDGFHLTDAASGVNFDIFDTGTAVRMGWTAKGAMNAFLALPGSDGLVHSAAQLFGSATPQPPSDCANGYKALAVYDSNHDGVIDQRDAIWPKLRLWIDANHDGVATADELYPLEALGVNSISLHYIEDRKFDKWGNEFRYRDQVNPDDPDASKVGRTAYDIYFVVNQ